MSVTLFKKITAFFLTLLSVYLPFLNYGTTDPFEARNPDAVRLSFAVISDTHLKENSIRDYMLSLGMADMASAKKLDALVVAGDTTDGGEAEQFEHFYSVLGNYNPCENYIIASGNHDCWNDEGFERSRELFIENYNSFTGSSITDLCYEKQVNGYHFIVIGTQEDSGVECSLTEEKLAWIDQSLALATADGRPVFVVCHQPIANTHGLPDVWDEGSIGEQSDELYEILKKYDNVFFITGHLHNGIDKNIIGETRKYDTYECDGSLHMLNLPCYMYFNSRGQAFSGMGLQFEVYNGSVIVRARSYAASAWYPYFEVNIDLV